MERDTTASSPAFAIPAHVYYREVDGQMVLLNLDTEEYYGLSEVGAAIVTRVTEEPWEEALATLTDRYDVDPDVLRSDIDELVADLVTAGLLEHVETTG